MQKKMKIEIWSDILCPFCYIGKRKFETALEQFDQKENIEVVWKSYLLSPDLVTDETKNIFENLAEHKGVRIERAKGMYQNVKEIASKVGLAYNLESMVVANSLKAHRLSHLAKQSGKQNQAEEKLFSAYFVEGKNIDDLTTLTAIATELGLESEGVKQIFETDLHAEDVRRDLYEAQQVGVRGVPHFVFNDKYSVSGAQESNVFSEILEKAYSEFNDSKPAFQMNVSIGKNSPSKL